MRPDTNVTIKCGVKASYINEMQKKKYVKSINNDRFRVRDEEVLYIYTLHS